MFLDLQSDGQSNGHATGGAVLALTDAWTIHNATAIEEELRGLDAGRALRVDATGISALDLTGAWLLFNALQALEQRQVAVTWQGSRPALLDFIAKTVEQSGDVAPAISKEDAAEEVDAARPVRKLGHWAVKQLLEGREALIFFGRLCVALGGALTHPSRMRWPALVRQVYETGVSAVPIVALIAFLISVIIAYMGAQQLRNFGAEIYVVDLVTVGVLRELGVLLTAIIVAGRSGSAFAAELGVMQLNDEVDALRAIGAQPAEVLVLPRVLGLVIALPLLTVVADAVGLAGGGLLSYFLLDLQPLQYLGRMQEAIAPTTFWVGIIKAPVFALLIACVGTLRGMQVRGSSRELGRLTTVAVVQSIFLVILADALFAVIFMELDI
jgi:phospholipid/cholesterol/gamma-HCH transport system permease protein